MKKYYGQFDPPVDKFIHERYFPDVSIRGVFVECGAYDGLTECSCKFFEETMAWQGYNFEPVPWIFDQLKENRPLSTNLNYALSNTCGIAKFKAVNHPQFGTNCTNGSLAHTAIHAKWLDEIGCSLVDVEVRLTTWSEFIKTNDIQYIDLLVLDVEGHELSVLEGMRESHVLPDCICIELCYSYDISSHVNAFFVKNSMIPIFAIRRLAMKGKKESLSEMFTELSQQNVFLKMQTQILEELAKITTNPSNELLTQIDGLGKENALLRGHIRSLEELLEAIKNSRGWIAVEKIRSLKKWFF
jgi:FkbM family methyltransferase